MAKKETLVEETTVEEVIERSYTLRKLKDSDIFPLLQILRKCGLKDFKDALTQATDGKSVEEVGEIVFFDIADKIIENISGAACDDIYEFYAGLSGISADEIKEMEFGTLPLMIYDSFNEVKNTSFFKVLSKLL